jgi:hypothetical protein
VLQEGNVHGSIFQAMTSEELASKMDRLQESIDLNNSLMTEFNSRLASIQESVSNKRGRMDAKEIINNIIGDLMVLLITKQQ